MAASKPRSDPAKSERDCARAVGIQGSRRLCAVPAPLMDVAVQSIECFQMFIAGKTIRAPSLWSTLRLVNDLGLWKDPEL